MRARRTLALALALATLAAGVAGGAAADGESARPANVAPLPPPGWIIGTAPVTVRIEHPAPPLPASGIRGYAVSVDRGAVPSSPCQGPDRCTEAELDLDGGIDDDTLSLGFLPQGAHVVRAVAVAGSGLRSAEAGSAVVRVDATPPQVKLRGVPQGWADGPVRVLAVATDPLSGMAPDGPGGPLTAITIGAGVATSAAGGAVATTVLGDGEHLVSGSARDAAGNATGAGDGDSAVVRIDRTPPAVAFADSRDRAEPERLEATVEDSLSGASPSRGSISVRLRGSGRPFIPLPTTAAGGRLLAHWDSDAFPSGTYEFRATGYDLAGNVASSERRANGTAMALANPLKTPTTIEAAFGGRRLVLRRCGRGAVDRRCRRRVVASFAGRPHRRTLRFGRGAEVAGLLRSADGQPLAAQAIQVIERFADGAAPARRTTTVQTGPDGVFLAHLAPGPSRLVEVDFAGSRTLARASAAALRLAVRGGVRMGASASAVRVGGAPILFSGRVAGDGSSAPPARLPVELQFRLPHGAWREFRTVETDRRGRFRYSYAFNDDDSRGVRFQFRAFVPAREGWPYEPAGSRPLLVTGR